MARLIKDRFSIPGQGVIIVLAGVTPEPKTRGLARVTRPDGTTLETIADRMFVKRVEPSAPNDDSFMLPHVDVSQVPEGSMFEIMTPAEFVGGKPPAAK